jgi:hypothetical protein
MSYRPSFLYFPGKIVLIVFLLFQSAVAQELYPPKLPVENWHNETRSLRYHPEGNDFVIVNGRRRFNRALYGTHSAFRVEAGDLPEFALYMPGLGGTFKIGIAKGKAQLWLSAAARIKARYTPGKMTYTIEDPLLGKGKIQVAVLAMNDREGMVVKCWYEGEAKDLSLIYAFGGASGKKFSRSGDMGPDPESSYYLNPENCIQNLYHINYHSFSLTYGREGASRLTGLFPTTPKLADAEKQQQPLDLYLSTAGKFPLLSSATKLIAGKPVYALISNPDSPLEKQPGTGIKTQQQKISLPDPAVVFTSAEDTRLTIVRRITLNTPDPYINALGGAIAIAADAIWEAPSYMHGAIGWRMRLNGWRGPYTADPLGWHERAKAHYESYARSQLLEPASGPVIADTAFHLARHQEKLGTAMFTEGYISRDPDGKSLRPHHYDMNLVYIDELLWHFNWTGDKALAKKMWPVLKRHLAWEKRNFDPDNDGLYDAYAVIWASDALYYSGAAVTHSSAYNYRANKKAAQIARLIAEKPDAYQQEAERILNAMNKQLWMPYKGVYAEYKDVMGLQLLHPSAALWTIYHSIDSEVPDPFQAWQSLRYIDTEIPHIPVRAAGLDNGNYYTLSTSNWMPYTWSINNVAMAESIHTALANWQAGRAEEGFKLFKSELLAAMYLGGSPANFVQISHYDAIRAEAYRDFADPIGVSSRALVEGLFGILPDALHGKLLIRPGFPSAWAHAEIGTPDINFTFVRNGLKDLYKLHQSFPVPLVVCLQLKARGSRVAKVLLNGRELSWRNITDAVGMPMIEVSTEGQKVSKGQEFEIIWAGSGFNKPVLEDVYAAADQLKLDLGNARVTSVKDPQGVFASHQFTGAGFTAIIAAGNGNKTAFVQLAMGSYSWWYPLCFEVKPELELAHPPSYDQGSYTFKLMNNSHQQISGSLSIKGFKQQIVLPPKSSSAIIQIGSADLTTGTNLLRFTSTMGKSIEIEMIDWTIPLAQGRQRSLALGAYFNDQVNQIFQHRYLTPRPANPTLQLPWQGIGDWPHALETVTIDDSGLRKLAADKNELVLPQGIKLQTPGQAGQSNIIFTSQWDNFPQDKEMPLAGNADHAYFLMAGSTNHMQSQLDNGKVVVTYTDGSMAQLLLRNPESWWPIQENYYTDGFAFKLTKPVPPRLYLKTGSIVITDKTAEQKLQPAGNHQIDGGAATILDLPLDPRKTLKSLKLVTLANDVVIGLMSVTLTEPDSNDIK